MEQSSPEFKEYQYPIGKKVLRHIKVAMDWDTPQFRDFLINIEKHFKPDQAFHDFRNVLVRIKPNETLGINNEIVVKKFKLRRKYDQFRFYFLPSKARRSLEIALTMIRNGLKTPYPVAIIEDRGPLNRLTNCYYLTEFLKSDCSFLNVINELDDITKRKIMTEAAQNIRLMHDAGIIHNDLHASNILVRNLSNQPELYYIDLNRARHKKALSVKIRAKDLGRLALKPQDQPGFFSSYDSQNNGHIMAKIHKAYDRRSRWVKLKHKLRRFKSKFKKRNS